MIGGCSRDVEAYVILCQITAEQSAESTKALL